MATSAGLCDTCLMRLANEYPSSGAPADAQLWRVLQTLVERADGTARSRSSTTSSAWTASF
jgi:hypothetical protein